MKDELFTFQKKALNELRQKSVEALGGYYRTHSPQVVSFTAPTGAGKTIIMVSLIEAIMFDEDMYSSQPDAIFVWLSDSPQLNEQSKQKIDLKADRIRLDQCVTIQDDSFDQEQLDDGHIYFLNTQKLGRGSNLVKHSDNRQFTIWETLANTAAEKSDRLYFIIDEAHRGMQGREAGKATTIMQKFLLGSEEDNLPVMPVVIGMSATVARFNKLVEGTTSTIHRVVVSTDEVRASGLLKDRIVITYPEDQSGNKDMAVLQAAADDWIEKWDHWQQYCYEQHYAYVNPIFVVQVSNGSGDILSDTDLDDCVKKIEDRVGFHFSEGEVVHTFGQTTATVFMNGLKVPYVEPSRIAEDKNIRVVFFKENLSTGWDCPRAETMMSFRHANDATYIAQLLGRMIRTPMQMHIQVDDTLNDVHLFLPYFNADTVKVVVDELQNSEGGDLPTEIQGEQIGSSTIQTLSIHPEPVRRVPTQLPGQQGMVFNPATNAIDKIVDAVKLPEDYSENATTHDPQRTVSTIPRIASGESTNNFTYSQIEQARIEVKDAVTIPQSTSPVIPVVNSNVFRSNIDRDEVMKFINDSGLLSYEVRGVRVSRSYLSSYYKLARLLTMSNLSSNAQKSAVNSVVGKIHQYIESIKSSGKYSELVSKIQEFKLTTEIFDVFGETVDNHALHDMFSTTDTDIDRQFRQAEAKLGNEGVGNEYGRQYFNEYEPNSFKIDVILYAANTNCMDELNDFAKEQFHLLNDQFRRLVPTLEERFRKQYDTIVADGDIVSKHNFRLPETINVELDENGEKYEDHLFVNSQGFAKISLNSWEKAVLEEERQQSDFVCWLRNPSGKPWSLCIPYQMGNETKRTFPDFLVIRRDGRTGYVMDILEPHSPDFADNLGKAKGFAEYARQNPGVGRIQLIRKARDVSGAGRFKRLDMSKSAIRDKVLSATTTDELNHLFETDGIYQ